MGPFNSKGEVALSEDMVWWWQVPLFLALCATPSRRACSMVTATRQNTHASVFSNAFPLCHLCASCWAALLRGLYPRVRGNSNISTLNIDLMMDRCALFMVQQDIACHHCQPERQPELRRPHMDSLQPDSCSRSHDDGESQDALSNAGDEQQH